MELDPFTLAAQAINFLILVWFLKRFLFERVGRIMDERARLTATARNEAAAAREEAERELARARALRGELEAAGEATLAAARTEAERLLARARAEARALGEGERELWKDDLARRREGFMRDLRLRTTSWLGALSRRVLSDLADEDLDPRLVGVFLERFDSLGEEELLPLREALARDSPELVVESDFALSGEDRERIQTAIRRRLEPGCSLVFRELGGLGLGIALEAGGIRIAWGLEEYLGEIEERIGASFDREAPGAGSHG